MDNTTSASVEVKNVILTVQFDSIKKQRIFWEWTIRTPTRTSHGTDLETSIFRKGSDEEQAELALDDLASFLEVALDVWKRREERDETFSAACLEDLTQYVTSDDLLLATMYTEEDDPRTNSNDS